MADKQVSGIPAFRELGTSGLKQSGGTLSEEFYRKLRWPQAGQIYQEMSSNDPVIAAILFCCRMLMRKVDWNVESCADTAADQECADFVQSCLGDMSETWEAFIDDLMSYFTYGFSYHEIVYKKRTGPNKDASKNSFYTDGRIGWRKLPSRRQTTISRWEFDVDGGLKGAYQQTDNKEIFLPIERCLLFRTTNWLGNPEGVSFLRGAYRPWYFKKHIEEVEGIGIERDLAGLPVITAPEGVDLNSTDDPKAIEARNAAMKLVSSIRRDRNDGVVMGYGWDIKLMSTGGSRQFDTNAVINRYDQRIAITLLADIIMLGADKVGSFALAKVKQSLLATALDAQLQDVCGVLNRYAIPRLIALNSFPGISGYPKIVAGSVTAPDLNELGSFIGSLSGAGMQLFPDENLENHIRQSAGLPLVPAGRKEPESSSETSGDDEKSPEPPEATEDGTPNETAKSPSEETPGKMSEETPASQS